MVDTIDDNTVLFVIGDHGMTSTGDHGGESPDEITSALFIYSPVPFLSSDIAIQNDIVNQVDIVPTLSAILGFAIPFSNLGKIILKALPDPRLDKEASSESVIPYALDLLLINIEKMMHYIHVYARTGVFSEEKFAILKERFHTLRNESEFVTDFESFKSFQNHSYDFLNFVRELCEEVWVQFDSLTMSRAPMLTFLLISLSLFIIEGIPQNRLIKVIESGFLWLSYGIVFLSAGGSAVLQYYKIVDDMFLLTYASTLTVSILMMGRIVVKNWKEITLSFSSYKTENLTDFISRFIHVCSLLLLFSNSFVVEEGLILYFLLNTVVWWISFNVNTFKLESQSHKNKGNEKVPSFAKIFHWSKCKYFILAVTFMLLMRVSFIFWRWVIELCHITIFLKCNRFNFFFQVQRRTKLVRSSNKPNQNPIVFQIQ